MPVYKRSNVIELSFNSILKQTHKPLELIIVDNNTDIKETNILKDISSGGQTLETEKIC